MIIAVIYWTVLLVFSVKIVGNLALPYGVLRMDDDKGSSIGLVLLADVILVSLAVLLAFFVDRPGWIHDPKYVLVMTCGVVLGSYVHYFVVLGIAAATRSG